MGALSTIFETFIPIYANLYKLQINLKPVASKLQPVVICRTEREISARFKIFIFWGVCHVCHTWSATILRSMQQKTKKIFCYYFNFKIQHFMPSGNKSIHRLWSPQRVIDFISPNQCLFKWTGLLNWFHIQEISGNIYANRKFQLALEILKVIDIVPT